MTDTSDRPAADWQPATTEGSDTGHLPPLPEEAYAPDATDLPDLPPLHPDPEVDPDTLAGDFTTPDVDVDALLGDAPDDNEGRG